MCVWGGGGTEVTPSWAITTEFQLLGHAHMYVHALRFIRSLESCSSEFIHVHIRTYVYEHSCVHVHVYICSCT